jgi:hypothetical protein
MATVWTWKISGAPARLMRSTKGAGSPNGNITAAV